MDMCHTPPPPTPTTSTPTASNPAEVRVATYRPLGIAVRGWLLVGTDAVLAPVGVLALLFLLLDPQPLA
jgi:hypothetical protein